MPAPGPYRPLRHAHRLSDQDRRVLELLEQPPLRVWPRRALAFAAGMSDRRLRRSIEALAAAHVPVISSSREGGYSIARTADEIAAWRAELISRMRVMRDKVEALEQVERLMRDREREGHPARPLALL